MNELDALNVARLIPKETLLGLLSGANTLHGGVVRDMGGRIVAHLAMPATATSLVPGLGWVADAFQTYQLAAIGLNLKRVESQVSSVLQLTTATTALAGLNLAVAVVGFAYLAKKLGEMNARLERVEKTTVKIKTILEAVQHSHLQTAIDSLRDASKASDAQTRHGLLLQSKQAFNQLVHQYQQLWKQEDSIEALEALDDCHTIAMVGVALSLNELGMGEQAHEEFARHRQTWQNLARGYCKDKVLRTDPQRLLHHRHLKSIPGDGLIALLDFANQSERGVGWLDELRRMDAKASILSVPSFGTEEATLQFARKLVAKDEVLDGYEAHFAFLGQHKIVAHEFDKRIEQATKQAQNDGPLWITLSEPKAA